jgi:NIMA (never in mitosis gene a)-related kinase 2
MFLIVCFRIINKKSSKIFIVQEYCSGGDMAALIKKCKKDRDYIAEDVIWKIFMQMLLALHECHHHKPHTILHRDIKPGNVFLDSQNNVKLGDFGLSRILSSESVYCTTHVGTPYYMSPEQITESHYDSKSDIWSCGCVLYEIAALEPPFRANSHLNLAMKVKKGAFERLPLRYSEDLQRVVRRMLNIDQRKRPTVEELLQLKPIMLRMKENKIKQTYQNLKRREEQIVQRGEAADKKLKELKEKEEKLKEKENEINTKLRKLETQQLVHKTEKKAERNEKCTAGGNGSLSARIRMFDSEEDMARNKQLPPLCPKVLSANNSFVFIS